MSECMHICLYFLVDFTLAALQQIYSLLHIVIVTIVCLKSAVPEFKLRSGSRFYTIVLVKNNTNIQMFRSDCISPGEPNKGWSDSREEGKSVENRWAWARLWLKLKNNQIRLLRDCIFLCNIWKNSFTACVEWMGPLLCVCAQMWHDVSAYSIVSHSPFSPPSFLCFKVSSSLASLLLPCPIFLSLSLFLLFHMASRPFLCHLCPSSALWCQPSYCHADHNKDEARACPLSFFLALCLPYKMCFVLLYTSVLLYLFLLDFLSLLYLCIYITSSL